MKRVAIYPGSFDPPTFGHLDLMERASSLFDQVVVAVGVNTTKRPFLPLEARLTALRELAQPFANVSVESFSGLLVTFARSRDCRILVRGLRAVTDFDYEFRVALANRQLAPEIETVFLLAREEYSFLASSVVREVATLGGDLSHFVPDVVAHLIRAQLQDEDASLGGHDS